MKPGTIIRFICDIHVGHEGTIPKGATGIYRGVSPDSEGYHLFEMGQDYGFLKVAYGYRNCFLGDGHYYDEDEGQGDIRVAGVEALHQVTSENLVATVRGLGEKFKYFHLSPCFCGAPVWQQPCPICGYYPMYGETNSGMDKGECTVELYAKAVKCAGGILEWYLKSYMSCVDPQKHLLDAAREQAEGIEWPTGEEIWEHFTQKETV